MRKEIRELHDQQLFGIALAQMGLTQSRGKDVIDRLAKLGVFSWNKQAPTLLPKITSIFEQRKTTPKVLAKSKIASYICPP